MDNEQQQTTQPLSEVPQPQGDKKSYAMTVVIGLFVFFLGALLLLAARGTNLQKTAEKAQTATTVVSEQLTQQVEGAMTEAGMKLTVTSPKDKSTVRKQVLTVTGKTAPNADVVVNDKELVANRIGYFSTTLTLDEGENVINVLVSDADGNYAEKELMVTYEPTQ